MANRVTPKPFPDMKKGILTNEKIGQLIRAKRTQKGLTLEKTAMLCNLQPTTLKNLENGAEGITLKSALIMLHNLGIRINFEGINDDPANN
jgi:transcriptional regulator with XRE-family HTH domain